MDSFEYAVTAGEGTLLRYGTTTLRPTLERIIEAALSQGHTVIIARAGDDCGTGQ